MDEEYQPSHSYTLNDLYLFKLLDETYVDLVNEVWQTAERQASLRHTIEHIQQRWEREMFVLQQQSSEPYSFAFAEAAASPAEERTTKFRITPPQHMLDVGDGVNVIVSVENAHELLVRLEEDVTLLQMLKSSAYASTFRHQMEHWSKLLRQVQEMVHLINKCQDQVTYTLWFIEMYT